MFIIFVIMLLLCFLTIRIHKKGLDEDYLSIPYTSVVKGIFIIFVFLSHARTYAQFQFKGDLLTIQVLDYLGQLMVALFLFYSGYGVFESVKRKGNQYVRDFPKNRILKTFIDFSFAILLFYILGECIGNHYSLQKVLLSLIGWESLGNSNWYMFAIFSLYILSYLCLRLFSKNKIIALCAMTICTLGYVYVMSILQPSRFSNTALCYLAGMWYSYFKEDIDKIFKNNTWIYYGVLIGIVILYLYIYPMKNQRILMHNFVSIIFSLMIVFAFKKISFHSKIVEWCGQHLFWLYILQRIPMIVLSYWHINTVSPFVFVLISLFITCLMAEYVQVFMTNFKNYLFSR